jgi:hypothetical protein
MRPDPSSITRNIQFHDHLNPKLWDGDRMRLDVRVHLLRVAISFYRFIEVKKLVISDMIVTGSNAAFNYTDQSDIDVHLVVDYQKSVCPDLAENFFAAKKNLWNDLHHVAIREHDVEVYVENSRAPAYSNGVYSLMRGEWLHKPSPQEPRFDDTAVVRKVEALAGQIDDVIESGSSEAIQAMQSRLKRMRQSGLSAGGEFSTENLTFKALRSLGYLDRLFQAKTDQEDADLSL